MYSERVTIFGPGTPVLSRCGFGHVPTAGFVTVAYGFSYRLGKVVAVTPKSVPGTPPTRDGLPGTFAFLLSSDDYMLLQASE